MIYNSSRRIRLAAYVLWFNWHHASEPEESCDQKDAKPRHHTRIDIFNISTSSSVTTKDSTSSPVIHVQNGAIIAIPNSPPISTWFALN
ncbi:MAG: hypothetical protein M3270_03675 [Thermoproteota archaeon]|nr:hypothetical protein [Thermoproteota archaeon]